MTARMCLPTAAAVEPVVLVLAAGRGARFFASGGREHKLQALLAGQSVLARVCQAVAQAGLRCHVIRPQGADTAGMGDSIACGVRATPDASGWLILPGDMPLVHPYTLRQIAQALGTHCALGEHAVQPYYAGQAGHPVAFSAGCASALLALHGDTGARHILQALYEQGQAQRLPVDDACVLRDIDTTADLHHATQWLAEQATQQAVSPPI